MAKAGQARFVAEGPNRVKASAFGLYFPPGKFPQPLLFFDQPKAAQALFVAGGLNTPQLPLLGCISRKGNVRSCNLSADDGRRSWAVRPESDRREEPVSGPGPLSGKAEYAVPVSRSLVPRSEERLQGGAVSPVTQRQRRLRRDRSRKGAERSEGVPRA